MADTAPWEDFGPAFPTKSPEPAPAPTPPPSESAPVQEESTPVPSKSQSGESFSAPPLTIRKNEPKPSTDQLPATASSAPWEDFGPAKGTAEEKTPGHPQSGMPSPDEISSSDNPPEGSRYAAARANLQKMADEYLIGKPSAGNEWSTGITHAADTALLNIPRNIAAAANAWRYGTSFSEEDALLRAEDAALERQNPKSAIAGDVAGVGIGAATLPMIGPQAGASRIASQLAMEGPGLATRAGFGALNSGLYSGAASLIDTKDPYEAAKATALGAGAGYLLTPVAEKLVGAASRLWTGKGSPVDAAGNLTQAAVDAATKAGIDPRDIPALTPHLIKAFQEKGISAPAAREAQLAEFNIPSTRGQVTADPHQIYREGQLPHDSPFGELKAEQQQAVGTAKGELSGTDYDTPTHAMENTIDKVQAAASRAKNKKNKMYGTAYGTPGFFQRDAMFDIGRNIRSHLDRDLEEVDETTPFSGKALRKIDDLSRMHVPNAVTPPIPNSQIEGIDMRGVENVRKKLNDYYAHSQGYDRLVMRKIIKQFDNEIQNAHEAGAFSGDSTAAIKAMEDARKANTTYKKKFFAEGHGDDVGHIVEKMIDGRLDANEVASYLYNDAQVGGRKSSRLYDALKTALRANSSGMNSLKDAIKLKLLSPNNPNSQGLISVMTDPQTANALEVAKRINNFINNKGSSLAEEMFTPEEIGQLRRYAGALNILGQKGIRPNNERVNTALMSLVKSAKFLAPLALLGFHGGIHGAVEGIALHPILSKAEKIVESMAERRAGQKAMAGAPRLQRVAPTFPLASPHRATEGMDQNGQ